MTGLLSILVQNPLLFVIVVVSLLISLTIHEFSHALVAHKLGDSTAKNLGRMTLNPLAHLDPLGTITLLIAGFGWGKPVPVNYYNLRNPKRDAALISLAGPTSNFIIATSLTLLAKVVLLTPFSIFAAFLYPVILYNLVLGVFNLIPIEPLDGFKIVNGVLPPRLAVQWVQLAPYGIFILLFLIVTGATSKIISPVVTLYTTILGI